MATSVISSLIFVTNIKTKTRITGLRFKKTSMRIKVVPKTKMKYEVEKNFEKKTNENNNYFSDKWDSLAINSIVILVPKIQPLTNRVM